jgi:hypothetical protein
MATFGIEGIRHFSHLRASGEAEKADDLTYTFNICNGLDDQLRDAGHTRAFYWAETDCWEKDLRDSSLGGIDRDWADNVDLFFILTHGGFWDGRGHLGYDAEEDKWLGDQNDYRLGNNWNLEWLLVYGCETVNRDDPLHLWDIFQRVHQYCGVYDSMWDGSTTDEVGEDVGDNLTDGKSVTSSWIDGVSDWWVDNHPIVVSAEVESTWNGGSFDWPNTTQTRDHLWGHGTTVADVGPADKYWLSWRWAEG